MKPYKPKSHYRHLKREDAQRIRDLYFSRKATQKQLAAQFKISQSAVCRIVSGWTWMEVK
jgi:DNA-binding transcriptional regulator LsrR (DeoR family)